MVERNVGSLTLTVNQAVSYLSNAYVSLINFKTPLRTFPSVMLWGAPGVGKSQGIRQVASRISERTGKRVDITDVRLLLFNPVDLRGIPTANADKTLAVWLKPKIFQMDESEDVINILFLDEISAAPQSVQAAAYQITLDRTVGEHKLPDNCIVVAAGNRVTDRSVAYTMPKALANRLCHMEIDVDHDSWHRWAVGAGINSIVLGFLQCNPSMLMKFNANSDALAFPTPRSWEMVSSILNCVTDEIADVFPLIVGLVGEAAAYELKTWSEIYGTIPKVEDVFRGNASGVPVRPESLYALSSEIPAYARDHHSDAEIKNAIRYVSLLPPEFKNRIFTDLLQIKKIRRQLYKNAIYDDWFARSGRYWEDYGINNDD
ncbi:MAG: AAA family ATPase [Clostridia bacterium]|nr:AAA family ATPase [Clostridia bacterium]